MLVPMVLLNTGHLTAKDAELLRAYGAERPLLGAVEADQYDGGWTINTGGMLDGDRDQAERFDEIRKEGFSEHFIGILRQAADNGAFLVKFDADGPQDKDLPFFDQEPEMGPAPRP